MVKESILHKDLIPSTKTQIQLMSDVLLDQLKKLEKSLPHPRFSDLSTALKEAIAAKAPFKWAKTSAGTAGHMLLFPASRRRFRRAAQLFNFLLRSSQPSKFTPVEMLHYD